MTEAKTGSVELKVRETSANIIRTQGSRGLDSCGVTDAGRLGGAGETSTVRIGGTEYDIAPETLFSLWPFSLLGKLLPHRLPKSPRNYQKWLERHNQ